MNKALSLGFYSFFYSLIVFYAHNLIRHYGVVTNLLLTAEHPDYHRLTGVGCLFLATDYFLKRANRNYYNNRMSVYYQLQLHHIIGISGYLMSYFAGIGQFITINLSLFEVSSIPLLFYTENIFPRTSFVLTWISFLFVRVLWGNYMLLSAMYDSFQPGLPFTRAVIFLGRLSLTFFLLANNFWFYMMTKKLKTIIADQHPRSSKKIR